MIKKMIVLAAIVSVSLAFTTYEPTEDTALPAEKSNTETIEVTPELSAKAEVELLYNSFASVNTTMPSMIAFSNGITGYDKLKDENQIENEILTIVDFSLPSTEKRMWILDMTNQKVLFNTYVSHGKNTGGDKATKFSNTVNSFQSSLGFYVTAETYYGKNGLSLFIDGMEEGFNSKARERYVVIHGADYASENFIDRLGRLGRSLGCPAVPMEVSKEIINTIKGKSGLFIYSEDKNYLEKSTYLNGQAV